MKGMMDQECVCPECGRSGSISEFTPKQYAQRRSGIKEDKSPMGLEVYIKRDNGTDEQEND